MALQQFPRTQIGNLSVSRMVIGTNNIMGGSHRTMARDVHIKRINNNRDAVSDIVLAYLEHGVDTIIGCLVNSPWSMEGIRQAEQIAGKKVTVIELAVFDTADTKEGHADAQAYINKCKANGIDICMPLHNVVESLVNKQKETIERIGEYTDMIREAGMIPGLSAHMPEIITYTDNHGYDVEVYIQIYNASGFLMQIEVETVHRIIWGAKKPVLTIKPMAAGHLNPFVGLNFVWNTLREQDMVAVGCMTPEEAKEVIEISYAALERRMPDVEGRSHQYEK